jgi:hypothetical protein
MDMIKAHDRDLAIPQSARCRVTEEVAAVDLHDVRPLVAKYAGDPWKVDEDTVLGVSQQLRALQAVQGGGAPSSLRRLPAGDHHGVLDSHGPEAPGLFSEVSVDPAFAAIDVEGGQVEDFHAC